jgi:hypothetical protein
LFQEFIMRRLVLATFVLGGMSSVTCADEPAKDKPSFVAPVPKEVTSDYLPYYLPASLPQPGTREAWQYYGVDNRGRWRARVILSPVGAYYYYNGEPFYYTTTQPKLYMPYVVD